MVAKISPQSPALTGKAGADALLASEKNTQNTVPVKPKKKMDTSYELNLSDSAKSQMASPLPAVNSREEAKKQLDIIKGASEKSASIFLSTQKPSAKSVVDLLA